MHFLALCFIISPFEASGHQYSADMTAKSPRLNLTTSYQMEDNRLWREGSPSSHMCTDTHTHTHAHTHTHTHTNVVQSGNIRTKLSQWTHKKAKMLMLHALLKDLHVK